MTRPADVAEWYEYAELHYYDVQLSIPQIPDYNRGTPDTPTQCVTAWVYVSPSGDLERVAAQTNDQLVINEFGRAGWLVEYFAFHNYATGGQPPSRFVSFFEYDEWRARVQYRNVYKLRRRHIAS
jgi:hypothetical protein